MNVQLFNLQIPPSIPPSTGQVLPHWLALLFLVVLLLAPFAEWRFIGLPLHGRPIHVDLDSYLSVSLFDVAFTLLGCAASYHFIRFARRSLPQALYLAHWLIALAIVGVLFISLDPLLPWLTPSQPNVVDTRSFLVHVLVGVMTTALAASLSRKQLLAGGRIFYGFSVLGAGVLSYLALSEFDYFRFHYPFTNPIAISFPFPNHNVAAPFFSLCLLGALGVASVCVARDRVLLVIAPAILIPAMALTGSRSNMVLASGLVLFFLVGTAWFSANRRNAARQHAAIVAGIILGAVALSLNYERQPIQRSLSMFRDFVRDPLSLLGKPDSPRNELRSLALSGAPAQDSSQARQYALALVIVRDGCIVGRAQTTWLSPEERYRVRLVLDRGRREASVMVSAPAGQVSVARSSLPEQIRPQHLFAFAADSGRRFTIVTGEISDYRLIIDGNELPIRPQADPAFILYETPFNGGATPILNLTGDAVSFNADTKILRGYVAKADVWKSGQNVELDYSLTINKLTSSMPLDSPAIFYIGFADSLSPKSEDQAVKTAVLIQHLRRSSDYELHLYRGGLAEEAARFLRGRALSGKTDKELLAELEHGRRCGTSHMPLKHLWSAPFDESILYQARHNLYGGVVDARSGDAISTLADPGWSSEKHLAYRGSTHNLYLDWLRYVGPWQASLFVLFVLVMNAVLLTAAWRSRRTPSFPILLSFALQVVLISALMYAQPYLFLKYYWLVFGVATGIAVNRSVLQEKTLLLYR